MIVALWGTGQALAFVYSDTERAAPAFAVFESWAQRALASLVLNLRLGSMTVFPTQRKPRWVGQPHLW